jgi:hypothetical protein
MALPCFVEVIKCTQWDCRASLAMTKNKYLWMNQLALSFARKGNVLHTPLSAQGEHPTDAHATMLRQHRYMRLKD